MKRHYYLSDDLDDLEQAQEPVLNAMVDTHPKLSRAAEGSARPALVVRGQDTFQRFMKAAP